MNQENLPELRVYQAKLDNEEHVKVQMADKKDENAEIGENDLEKKPYLHEIIEARTLMEKAIEAAVMDFEKLSGYRVWVNRINLGSVASVLGHITTGVEAEIKFNRSAAGAA